LLGLVQEALNADVSLLSRLFEELADAVGGGVAAWVQQKLAQAQELLNDLPNLLWNAVLQMVPEVLGKIAVQIVARATAKAAAALATGGLGELLMTLYKAVQWIWQNRQRLLLSLA
jgi:hypothetical protein